MTGTGRVGVGLIGAGNISDQYLQNLTTFPDVEVLFVADIDVDRARHQAERYGVPGSGTPGELLADPAVEIVVNLTVPAAHVAVAMSALAAGKHVWTEKPIALDRESAGMLLAEATERGLRVATAPDTFLGAGLQAGKRLIEGGSIGRPLTATVLLQSPGPEPWHPNPDFFYVHGGGPLFDMGPYYLTTLVQNLGPASRVAATTSVASAERIIGSGARAGERIPVEVATHVSALLEFEGGASAQCTFSFQSAIRRNLIEFSGTTGTLVFPDPNNFDGDLELWTAESEAPETITTTALAGRGTGIVELARAIRADVPERASGEQAHHVLDIMVSILEAADTGHSVPVRSTVAAALALPEGWDPRAATL